jgi:hypothetical protein
LQLVEPLEAVHATVFCALPAVAETPVGAAGTELTVPPPPAIIIPDKPAAQSDDVINKQTKQNKNINFFMLFSLI